MIPAALFSPEHQGTLPRPEAVAFGSVEAPPLSFISLPVIIFKGSGCALPLPPHRNQIVPPVVLVVDTALLSTHTQILPGGLPVQRSHGPNTPDCPEYIGLFKINILL